jgi:glutaredoxin 3
MGEPMEWSEKESLANKFSEMIASNDIGYTMKQLIADLVAGKDFDQEQTAREIDAFIETHPVAMYAFESCPFCRRAKDYLEERGIPYTAIDLDLLDGNRGNEIRAILGRKTRRTSMPAIFIGTTFIGGCNDGPGLLPLAASGELDKLLQDAKVSFSR